MEFDNSTPEGQLKGVGLAFMLLAVIGAIEGISSLLLPSASDAATLSSVPPVAIIIAIVLGLAISAVEFYFGYIAYKGRATKTAAIICLVIAVFGALGVVSSLTTGVSFLTILKDACDCLLSFLYYFYWKKTQA